MLLGEMLEQSTSNGIDIPVEPKQTTKEDLLKIIKEKERDIASLHAEIDKLEKYRVHQEAADEMKAMHTAFMNSGFSNEQAFQLVHKMLAGVIEANSDKLRFIR